MKSINKRGDAEIISYVFLILIISLIVGSIFTFAIPEIAKQQSITKFNNSKDYIDNIDNSIQTIMVSPIDSTEIINLNLNNLYLEIDSDANTIKIYHLINGNYYENKRLITNGAKYTYRDVQKLYAGLQYNEIDITTDIAAQNTKITLYLQKIGKNQLQITTETIEKTKWYNSSWSHRIPLLINKSYVESDLTNFPVYIELTSSDLNTHSKNDGSDILFTLGDGTTKLNREIEEYITTPVYRKKIIIDHNNVIGDLNNFPVYISITDSNLASYARTDGKDIYFTLDNNRTNRLYREIEDFNKTTGTLSAWVNIPYLSSTVDTEIDMYFGDNYSYFENDTGTWDENYLMVLHLNKIDNNIVKDSTDNNINGTTYSSTTICGGIVGCPRTASGKVSIGINVDGTNDYIKTSSTNFLPLIGNNYTLSTWIKDDTAASTLNSTFHRIISFANGTINVQLGLATDGPGTERIFYIQESNSSNVKQVTAGNATLTWHHVVATSNGSNWNIYLDGNLSNDGTTTNSGSTIDTTNTGNLYVGQRSNGGYVNGNIDNVQISNIARSSSWIATEYNNQNSPETFYSVQSTETIYENRLIAWVNIPNLSSSTDTLLYIYFGNPNGDEENSTSVWDSNYIGIWHSKDNNTSTISDSTINTSTGTKKATNEPTQTIGKIGYAQNYDGDNDYINFGNKNLFNLGNTATISIWLNSPTTWIGDTYPNLVSKGASAGWDTNGWSIYAFSNHTIGVGMRNLSTSFSRSFQNTIKSNWTYIVGTWNGTTVTIYQDGQIKTTPITQTISPAINDYNLFFGKGYNCNHFFGGSIDEVRISSTARSSSWIETEFNNQANPDLFYSIGEVERR